LMTIRISNQAIVEVNLKEINNKKTGRIKGNTKTGDHLSSGVRVVAWVTILTGLEVARGDQVAVNLEKAVIAKIIEVLHSIEAEDLKELEEEGIGLTTMNSIDMIKTLMREKLGLRVSDLIKTNIIATEAWGGAFS
jgi:hypothetical protein